ncbi:MAG: hypothetical protein VX278_17645, partial [Myxococcota bacterium]|nr:hypothetical protein [Myxococcota bacterium]
TRPARSIFTVQSKREETVQKRALRSRSAPETVEASRRELDISAVAFPKREDGVRGTSASDRKGRSVPTIASTRSYQRGIQTLQRVLSSPMSFVKPKEGESVSKSGQQRTMVAVQRSPSWQRENMLVRSNPEPERFVRSKELPQEIQSRVPPEVRSARQAEEVVRIIQEEVGKGQVSRSVAKKAIRLISNRIFGQRKIARPRWSRSLSLPIVKKAVDLTPLDEPKTRTSPQKKTVERVRSLPRRFIRPSSRSAPSLSFVSNVSKDAPDQRSAPNRSPERPAASRQQRNEKSVTPSSTPRWSSVSRMIATPRSPSANRAEGMVVVRSSNTVSDRPQRLSATSILRDRNREPAKPAPRSSARRIVSAQRQRKRISPSLGTVSNVVVAPERAAQISESTPMVSGDVRASVDRERRPRKGRFIAAKASTEQVFALKPPSQSSEISRQKKEREETLEKARKERVKRRKKTKKRKKSRKESLGKMAARVSLGKKAREILEEEWSEEVEWSEEDRGKSKSWTAPEEVVEELTKKIRRQVKKETDKAPQKERKEKKRSGKNVIGEIAEEELMLVLRELAEDTPEAKKLLEDIFQRVETLKKLEHFRKI